MLGALQNLPSFLKSMIFSKMSNHFHLLVRMETGEDYSGEAVYQRLKAFYE